MFVMNHNLKIGAYFVFVFSLLLVIPNCSHEQPTIPFSFIKSFNQLHLDKKYKIATYLKPSFLRADFDGDGINDIVALVVERNTNKKGILLISGSKYFVFGAGTNFGNGSDDFKWASGWGIYNKKIAYQTAVNSEGDLIGSKEKKLKRTAFYIYQVEDGAPVSGGIIYWNDNKYIWIQQGD